MVSRLVVAGALLAFGGCATPPPQPSLYQRLGGLPAIDAVVGDAIGNIAADYRINLRFTLAGLPQVKKNLAELVCERTGGPCVYKGADMSAAHEGMRIRDDEFDALVEDLVKSLDKFKVPPREKAELAAILAGMKNAIVGH
jgi:hemoglobin